MANMIFTVEDTSAPNFILTLLRDTVAIDLTTASAVSLIVKNERTAVITNTGHQSCVVDTPAQGKVHYSPQVADFPDPGRYKCDIRIDWNGGAIEILNDQVIVIAREKN